MRVVLEQLYIIILIWLYLFFHRLVSFQFQSLAASSFISCKILVKYEYENTTTAHAKSITIKLTFLKCLQILRISHLSV